MNENTAKPSIRHNRQSSIELLRIIAMLLICVGHAFQTYNSHLSQADGVSAITTHGAQLGNTLFIVCAAWFLADSRQTKPAKMIGILLDSTLISIVLFGITFATMHNSLNLGLGVIIHQFLPDLFSQLWFIPCYVLLYLIHPLLNVAMDKMNAKSHLAFVLIAFVLYGVLNGAGASLPVCELIEFVLIYIFVGYAKKYATRFCGSIKWNFFAGLCSLLMIGLVFTLRYLFRTNDRVVLLLGFSLIKCGFLMVLGLCIFNLFRKLTFSSKSVNFIASATLFVYCIHENYMLGTYVRPRYYDYVLQQFPNVNGIWFAFLCGIGMFVGGYILAIMYEVTAHRFTAWLSKKIEHVGSKALDKMVKWNHNHIE